MASLGNKHKIIISHIHTATNLYNLDVIATKQGIKLHLQY